MLDIRQQFQPSAEIAVPIRPNLSPPPPKRLPSKKWRNVIRQVWHTDPLRCPVCQDPMRVIAVINQRAGVEKILLHLGLWTEILALASPRSPPGVGDGPWTREPFDALDPVPDYENVLPD